MNWLWAQLWVPAVALLVGGGMGWMGRRLVARAELRRMIDRLLLGDNELRSARAALIRERQLRLGAQTALRQAESERDALVGRGRSLVRGSSRATSEEIAADEMMTGELEDLMVEVDAGYSSEMPGSAELTRFRAFGGGDYSEPPPRVSDVRELRRERGNDEITRRAYELWDAAGRPSGQDLHFWCQAEEQLRSEALHEAEAPLQSAAGH